MGSVSCIFDHVRRAADFEVNVEHGAVEPARGEAPLHMLTDKERNFVQGKALAAYAVAFPNEIKSMSGD